MLNSFNLRKKYSTEAMLVSEYFNGNAKMVRKTKVGNCSKCQNRK